MQSDIQKEKNSSVDPAMCKITIIKNQHSEHNLIERFTQPTGRINNNSYNEHKQGQFNLN